jgi:hypothetical protein
LARLREAERLPPLRAADLRTRDREDFRALLRAEARPPRLAALPARLADLRALFLAPLRADFLAPLLAERAADFLRGLAREPALSSARLPVDGSSKSKDGDDAGVGEGVLSEGSGSIHPEPDQPISI